MAVEKSSGNCVPGDSAVCDGFLCACVAIGKTIHKRAHTAKLLNADQSYAELVPGENIRLAFMLPKQTTEARTHIVIAKGHYYTIPLQEARAFVEYPWNIW